MQTTLHHLVSKPVFYRGRGVEHSVMMMRMKISRIEDITNLKMRIDLNFIVIVKMKKCGEKTFTISFGHTNLHMFLWILINTMSSISMTTQ